MNLSETLVYDGRRYVVLGVDPMSVDPGRVYLRDEQSGDLLTVLRDDLVGEVRGHLGVVRPPQE